jgi:hypothetical protein
MTKYLSYLIILFLFGCSESSSRNNRYKSSNKEIISDEIMKNVAACLKKENGLQPCGTGGQMMDQVKMLALAFTYNKPLEIEEGRKLLIHAVETFISMINNDERIRPYLSDHPFEPKNIEIMIAIKNLDHSSVPPEKICLLTAKRGILEYDVHDSKTSLMKTIYKESFFEAKQKIWQ